MENYNKHIVTKNRHGDIWFERYLLNTIEHRIDGPAYIAYYDNGNIEFEQYKLNGKFHRINGPQFTCYDKNGDMIFQEFWIFGKKLTKEQFYTPGFIDIFILENS